VQVLKEASKVQGGTSATFRWEHPNSNHAGGTSSFPSDRTVSHDPILDMLEVLETRATEETRGFGGCNFSTPHDEVGFVTKHTVPICAMCWDVLSVMVSIRSKGEQRAVGKEMGGQEG
jgi:hypothetical protein